MDAIQSTLQEDAATRMNPSPFVTTATYITLVRILLIPVFLGFALYYTKSIREGEPDETLRTVAVIIFTIAAVSDFVDGWIARKFNQKSRLGSILDPLADKLLLLATVVTLCLPEWPVRLPLWFVIIVFSREVLSIAGAFLVQHVAGKVDIHPHWSGKAATALLIFSAGLAMISQEKMVIWFGALACLLVLTSAFINIHEAVRQMHDPRNHERHPDSHS